MATLTDQIESLIAYANETTGKADTKLGDAVKSLADGYGGGGEHGCVEGEVTINSELGVITINRSVPIQPYHVELRYKGDLSTVGAATVGIDVVKNIYIDDYVQLCFRNGGGVYTKNHYTNIGIDGCTIGCYSTAKFPIGDYSYKISY